jgi:hypothetical protein
MTAKTIADISEAMEKLGYEVIKIKERHGDFVFRPTVEFKLRLAKRRTEGAKKAKA